MTDQEKIADLEKRLAEQQNRETHLRATSYKWMKRCFDAEKELRKIREWRFGKR